MWYLIVLVPDLCTLTDLGVGEMGFMLCFMVYTFLCNNPSRGGGVYKFEELDLFYFFFQTTQPILGNLGIKYILHNGLKELC